MYLSLVSSLDPNPNPKCNPYLHMKNHHDRWFVIVMEAAQNSLILLQTVNGSVLWLRHSSVRVPHNSHQPHRRIRKGSAKKNRMKTNRLQRKRVDATKGQPRETSSHEVKQETLETGQLSEISDTAEIIKENQSSEVYAQ